MTYCYVFFPNKLGFFVKFNEHQGCVNPILNHINFIFETDV